MESKLRIGKTLRQLREATGLSQEKLAAKADITYQYLSAIENGKENFTISVLEGLSGALSTDLPSVILKAYELDSTSPVAVPGDFIPEVPLPPGLNIKHVRAAMEETMRVVSLVNHTLRRVTGRSLSEYIQANNFSGIVSNILCDAFSRLTPYKHNHSQRYPDLMYEGATPAKACGLEIKTTTRPGKGGESHNGHSGWHLIACFKILPEAGDIRFIHIMLANLYGHGCEEPDWRYLGSKVNDETGSQRTETYMTTPRGTAKLRHGTVYLDRAEINIARWRTSLEVIPPPCSPFQLKKPSKD